MLSLLYFVETNNQRFHTKELMLSIHPSGLVIKCACISSQILVGRQMCSCQAHSPFHLGRVADLVIYRIVALFEHAPLFECSRTGSLL